MQDGREPVVQDVYPLSALQQGMLFHILDAPAARLYVNQQVHAIEGDLDGGILRHAFQQVIDRHKSLRAALLFTSRGEPVQLIFQNAEIPWEQHDWQAHSSPRQDEMLAQLLAEDQDRPFDLARPPLLRVSLVRLGPTHYQLIWSFHLIVVDGWSIPIIFQELIACYRALRLGQPGNLAQTPDYSSYIDWVTRQDSRQAETFWRSALAGFATPTTLGSDRMPGEITDQAPNYAEQYLVLEENDSAALNAFAADGKLTLNTLIQGAWALILARRTGTDDVVFGSVTSGRPVDLPGSESMVGFFLNTIPVRVRVPDTASVLPWLAELQLKQAEARSYEGSTLVDIQGWSELPHGQPLFDSVLIVQNIPVELDLLAEGAKVLGIRSTERNSFPLTLTVVPGDRLLFKIVYNTTRFSPSAIARTLEKLRALLMKLIVSPGTPLASLSAKKDGSGLRQINNFNRDLAVQ
jgi:hypothetical protein